MNFEGLAQDLQATVSGIVLWSVGLQQELPWLQAGGIIIGAIGVACAVSREIRHWVRKDK